MGLIYFIVMSGEDEDHVEDFVEIEPGTVSERSTFRCVAFSYIGKQ